MVGLDKMSAASQKSESSFSASSGWVGNKNFTSRYEAFCSKNNSHPLKDIKLASSSFEGTLDLLVDKIKFNDWLPLLKALAGDRSLHSISFKSRVPQGCVDETIVTDRQARDMKKGTVLFSSFLLQKFIAACIECLENSKKIRMFHLEKIPLTQESFKSLSLGVSQTCCLQKLILNGCHIDDEGCQYIADAIKKVPSIRTLDLSANNISSKGVKYLAGLIKFQDISRYNECWKHSLRNREINNDAIPGLRRLTINDNSEVGDKGLKYIVETLFDDNWMKAIDMQNCGITDWGCSFVHQLLETNNEIVVFDVRRNDIINMTSIASIISILGTHTNETDINEFGWMDIATPQGGSTEDSSSGGGSCNSYNLAYSNEKVAEYIETIAVGGRSARNVKSLDAIASSQIVVPVKQRRNLKPVQRSETSLVKGKKLSLIPSIEQLMKAHCPKNVLHPKKVWNRNAPKAVPQRQLSLANISQYGGKQVSLRSTRSDERFIASANRPYSKTSVLEEQPLLVSKEETQNSEDSGKKSERQTILQAFCREEVVQQTVNMGRLYSKSSDASCSGDKLPALDSTEKIELALQKLFKSFGDSTGNKTKPKSDSNSISSELKNTSSKDDFSENENIFRKSNRRIKETKQMCCLYFNRLEDGYEE